MIKLNLDDRGYKKKPTKFGVIRNRVSTPEMQQEVSIAKLAEAIAEGRCFTRAQMNGTGGADFVSQSILVADIDNEGAEILHPDTLPGDMEFDEMPPALIYTTYSHSELKPKFRVVCKLDAPIEDPERALQLNNAFIAYFNSLAEGCCDTQTGDLARMFLGSHQDSICYTDPEATLSTSDLPQCLLSLVENSKLDGKPATDQTAPAGVASPELDRLSRDKASFDLEQYILSTTDSAPGRNGFWNPCPICGHDNDFKIDTKDGVQVWHCFGGSNRTGITGGTIIDYIRAKRGVETGEAIFIFNREIMGYTEADDAREDFEGEFAPPEGAEEYYKSATKNRLDIFEEKRDLTDFTPTGFTDLDRILNGGLYPGLYILGAMSSMGKTSFMLQMADQITASGKDCLYFSLEMAEQELVSKSLSRLTFTLSAGDMALSKPAYMLSTKRYYHAMSDREKAHVRRAMEAYNSASGHLIVKEGVGDISIDDIKKAVADHIGITGKRPIVFIDYLQILAPKKGWENASDKRIIDNAITELKRLSRDSNIPVVIISSFNRGSYDQAETEQTAFKESGGIEYGADVLIALQAYVNYGVAELIEDGNTSESKAKKIVANTIKRVEKAPIKEEELKILKNRQGVRGGKIRYTYYAVYNNFVELKD